MFAFRLCSWSQAAHAAEGQLLQCRFHTPAVGHEAGKFIFHTRPCPAEQCVDL